MNKSLKKQMTSIALPIMLQNLILSLINLADVFMIGRVGNIEIAAVGLSNQIQFLFVLFCMGINNAGSIFIAQYFGRGEKDKIKTVLGITMMISIALALIFSIMAFFLPETLMRIYTSDQEVINSAIPYLKVIAIAYIFTAFTIVYSTLLRSMGNTKMAMYASIVTLMINVILNYLLIFGNLGFPKMGVAGAALATSIARFFELCTIIIVSKKKKYDISLKIEHFKTITKDFVKEFFKTGLPVIGSHVIWSLGATTLFMIYARVGTAAVTAMNISGSFANIAFIAIVGIGSAVGVIVGQELGRGNEETAYKLSKDMLKLNGKLGLIVGLLIMISADLLVSFYNIPPEIKKVSANVIRILALFFPLRALNFTNMVGIMRAGGDTKHIMMIDILAMWGTGIPLAFLGYKLGLSVYFVYMLACGEDITKFVLSMKRFLSKKWIKTVA